MKFIIQNNILMQHLQKINRVITKNTNCPILENILITIKNNILSLTATNIEIELIVHISQFIQYESGSITIPGIKLLHICRNASEFSEIKIELKKQKIYIFSEQSKYILTTSSIDDFPNHSSFQYSSEFLISSNKLKKMIEKTSFSMGKNDVRYYLNSMLLENQDKKFCTVTTDGYRLSFSQCTLQNITTSFSMIVPRKGIIELYRLLNIPEQTLRFLINQNYFRIHIGELIYTAQLIAGQYPNYSDVMLKMKKKPIVLNRQILKKSLQRVSILSHEKFCGVEIHIEKNQFTVSSSNQAEETAQDTFNIHYLDKTIEISVNVYYILDILNVISSENIFLFLNETNNSIEITSSNENATSYVVMLLKN